MIFCSEHITITRGYCDSTMIKNTMIKEYYDKRIL